MPTPKSVHLPVLKESVLVLLAPQPGQSYLDLTAGYGGHTAAVIDVTGAPDKAVLVDRDHQAAQTLSEKFAGTGAAVIESDFLSALERLVSENRTFDMVLADLGVSSPHLEEPGRGFSFSRPGPLDMRMDQGQTLSAERIVNSYPEAELARILSSYGEEPRAKSIARAIVSGRPIKDTVHLAAIIAKAAGSGGKIHPATKSFQAIRIAVNDELLQLERALPKMISVLKPGGRLAVISFHSLEDRLVKQFFAEKSGAVYDAELMLLTKRPVTASRDEIASNPRARSAKLRAASKIKNT